MTTNEVLAVCGTIISLLLGGNIYFIKQVFDKVNTTSTNQTQQGAAMSAVSTSITDIKGDMREVRQDLKRIPDIEKELAIIQTTLKFNPQFSGLTKGTT